MKTLKFYDSIIDTMVIRKLNDVQIAKTADLSLDVGKTILLATVIGLLIPGVGDRVGLTGSLIGFIVFTACYLFAMWLLREVRGK